MVKLTAKNYLKQSEKIDFSTLPKAVRDSHNDVVQFLDLYDEDNDLKSDIDFHIKTVNSLLSKKGNSDKKSTTRRKKETSTQRRAKVSKSRTKRPSTTKKRVTPNKAKTTATTKKTSRTKTSASKPKPTVKKVEHFTEDVRLLKRFVNLVDKKKTRKQLLAVYRDFEKRITERKVTKESKLSDLVSLASKFLESICRKLKSDEETFILTPSERNKETFERMQYAAKESAVRTSVSLLKRFIGMEGKSNPSKISVSNLHKAMVSALEKGRVSKNDIYYDEILKARKALADFMVSQDNTIAISKTALNGISCACGTAKTNSRKK